MEIISIPRLTLGALQSLTESTLKICSPIAELGDDTAAVTEIFNEFKESMKKEHVSAAVKRALDGARDSLHIGLERAVESELLYPGYDAASKDAIAAVARIMDKYGVGIKNLPRNTETAALDNEIDELEALDAAPLKDTSIPRWFSLIKASNNKYKEATREFNSNSTEAAEIEAASKLAPALTEALSELYISHFALARYTKNSELVKSYTEVYNLVESYR